jgi:superfamily II DNA or RNA helicase
MNNIYSLPQVPQELTLGTRLNERVPKADQRRQRAEVEEILQRFSSKPGVILADEVGMGKTFVALAVAYSVATSSLRGPVIVMVPANLMAKWEQDLKTFCELYLENRQPVERNETSVKYLANAKAVRYGIARHSIELMKLLDDPPRQRCHLIFLAQGAMGRRQTDKWVRLALIAEALRFHGRGMADRLIQVKEQIHRFLAELLWAIGEERANDWGDELWQRLLRTDPAGWKKIYNSAARDQRRLLSDDPVPKSVTRALLRINLRPLANALKQMPIRARGGDTRVSERINEARTILRRVEEELWKKLLAEARWRSPLLVMDEAHHLKNPYTSLARQLQSADSEEDLRTGDGAMSNAFDRMLFLTATPFQLGHYELVRVLERFGDVRWEESKLGKREDFSQQMEELSRCLNDSQRTAIALQRCWSKLRLEDCGNDVETWWNQLLGSPTELLNSRQRAVTDAYSCAQRYREMAEKALRPWIIRHNKGTYWPGTSIPRRHRLEGASIAGQDASTGLPIPQSQLLPFFLAARSVIRREQDLLGEALSSSYEAFRFTRQNRKAAKDEQDESLTNAVNLSHADWYLSEFDCALERCSGSAHPKVNATVRKVVDLWEAGEKVLVFGFYRHTCRALSIHISREAERRIMLTGEQKLRKAGREGDHREIERLIEHTQKRYFDTIDSPGRRAVDAALSEIIETQRITLDRAQVSDEQCEMLMDVMRRFLRVATTLARYFPLGELDSLKPNEAIARTLGHVDVSGVSWKHKFGGFLDFLANQCSTEERRLYLEAAVSTSTRDILVEDEEDEDIGIPHARTSVLANIRVATGKTRRDTRTQLMRSFNTPFFPDILVCSEVMGEGVDLQRFCRHVIHHDLAWNPSTIEQRTGRIDRLGCKAESRQPIVVYLPFLAGTADERQYRVMSDRERWFRVVMGQAEVAKLITPDGENTILLPIAVIEELSFDLGLSPRDKNNS